MGILIRRGPCHYDGGLHVMSSTHVISIPFYFIDDGMEKVVIPLY